MGIVARSPFYQTPKTRGYGAEAGLSRAGNVSGMAFSVTLSVEDADVEVLVPALPPIGAVINLRQTGTVKVNTIEVSDADGPDQPLRIRLTCVPILSF